MLLLIPRRMFLSLRIPLPTPKNSNMKKLKTTFTHLRVIISPFLSVSSCFSFLPSPLPPKPQQLATCYLSTKASLQLIMGVFIFPSIWTPTRGTTRPLINSSDDGVTHCFHLFQLLLVVLCLCILVVVQPQKRK